jgi:hypothetical protein
MAETEHREAEHTAGLINIGVGFVTNLPRRCHPPAGVRPSGGGRMGFVAGLVAGDAERPWPSARVWPRSLPPAACAREMSARVRGFPTAVAKKRLARVSPVGWAGHLRARGVRFRSRCARVPSQPHQLPFFRRVRFLAHICQASEDRLIGKKPL